MVGIGLNFGKAALAAVGKLVGARAGQKVAEQTVKKTVEKTVELLGTGEVVEKIAEVATAVGSPEASTDFSEPSVPEPAPAEPPASSEPPAPDPMPEAPAPTPTPPTPPTLSRVLPDGDNDGGKGWQCSKYAWYLATGVRMNYAPHPDYGPCHGAAMVDYLITNLGWRECEKKTGAIFAYNDPQFGHTGAVVDASRNLVSDANTLARPLAVDTHVLPLDSLHARYAEEAK